MSFAWGSCPSAARAETGTTETEVRSPLPVVLNGQILPGGGSDRFVSRLERRAIVAIVKRPRPDPLPGRRRAGWFQAAVTLYDPQGEEVAYADDYRFQPDPVLTYEVPADGRYVLEIKDALYRGRQDFVYRIALGVGTPVNGSAPAQIE